MALLRGGWFGHKEKEKGIGLPTNAGEPERPFLHSGGARGKAEHRHIDSKAPGKAVERV